MSRESSFHDFWFTYLARGTSHQMSQVWKTHRSNHDTKLQNSNTSIALWFSSLLCQRYRCMESAIVNQQSKGRLLHRRITKCISSDINNTMDNRFDVSIWIIIDERNFCITKHTPVNWTLFISHYCDFRSGDLRPELKFPWFTTQKMCAPQFNKTQS